MMSKPRAIKTHFKLSSLSFSLLESSNTSFQVQGPGRAQGHGQPMPPPFLSPASRHLPSSRALQALCRAGRRAWPFGGEGQRGTILAHTSEHWLWHFPLLHNLATQTFPPALIRYHLSATPVSKIPTRCSANHHRNTSVRSGKVHGDHKEQLSLLKND